MFAQINENVWCFNGNKEVTALDLDAIDKKVNDDDFNNILWRKGMKIPFKQELKICLNFVKLVIKKKTAK